MELWVRSQNKGKLVNVKALSLFASNVIKNDFVLNDNSDYSSISIIANDNYNIGTYKTKERALEVLDEIQEFISGREIMHKMNKVGGNINNIFPTMIFIMPKE